MSLVMSREECQAFLADAHVGILSIPDRNHGPLTVPIWYLYEPGGEVTVLTPPDSRKGRLLREGGRISFCVQSEELPYKYVSVEGPVTSIRPADVERDVMPLASRYLGAEVARGYVSATRPDGTTAEVVIRMRPERWLSADFAKRLQAAS